MVDEEEIRRRWITLAEAVEILGVDQSTLRRAAQRGRLRAVKPGHDWMTTREWVEEFKPLLRRRGQGSHAKRDGFSGFARGERGR